MERYKVTIHSDDLICYVLATDEENAIDKYYEDEIDEWEVEPEQPDVKVELEL